MLVRWIALDVQGITGRIIKERNRKLKTVTNRFERQSSSNSFGEVVVFAQRF